MDRKIRVTVLGLAVGLVGLPAARAAHPPAGEGTPATVLQSLTEGNNRFANNKGRIGDQSVRRDELVKGQAPGAIVLSCSDSRVPPEDVFDQGLGSLFVVRVAGEVIDPATVASIEYAVAHLGSKLIVVLGHTYCGAVKAALETPAGQSAGSKDLDLLVGPIRENLAGKTYSYKDDPSLAAAVDAQAQAVARDLPRRSQIIRDAVKAGTLKIVSGTYDLSTGKVKFDNGEPLPPVPEL